MPATRRKGGGTGGAESSNISGGGGGGDGGGATQEEVSVLSPPSAIAQTDSMTPSAIYKGGGCCSARRDGARSRHGLATRDEFCAEPAVVAARGPLRFWPRLDPPRLASQHGPLPVPRRLPACLGPSHLGGIIVGRPGIPSVCQFELGACRAGTVSVSPLFGLAAFLQRRERSRRRGTRPRGTATDGATLLLGCCFRKSERAGVFNMSRVLAYVHKGGV